MKLTLARCFLIVAVSVVPIRMSLSEIGRSFWYGFGYEWLWFLWVLGFASRPDKTITAVGHRAAYDVTDAYWRGAAAYQADWPARWGVVAGVITNIVAALAFIALVAIAWRATASRSKESPE